MGEQQIFGKLKQRWRICVAGIAALALAALGFAAPIAKAADAGTVLIGSFDHPLYIASAPAQPHLLFIVEQSGRIQILSDETRLDHAFLDISGLISFGASTPERGLLSVAFPPDYDASGRFYVAFTNTNGDVELDEFLRQASVPHPIAANHNGGQLQFGPRDGYLYMSVGDGGNISPPGEPARRLDDLRGKMLRVKPLPKGTRAYTIPRSNPFLDRPGARGEIYAYGLRNPWRFVFDDRRLIIADVGQSSREEVDFLRTRDVAGANFGWPQYEGDIVFDNTCPGPDPPVFPILTYPHSGGACAIIGGYVVHDPNLPQLRDRYLYGDLCTGEVRSFFARVGAQKAAGDRPTGVIATRLSGFGLGSQGQIYLAQITGHVTRLVPP